jgi:WD40 repeat protein
MRNNEEENVITAVNWAKDGRYIALGCNDGNTQLWDAENQKPLRNLGGHSARVSSLAWNNHILTTGSRDSTINLHDVRIGNSVVATLRSHEQEVCGLKYNEDGTQLASGGKIPSMDIKLTF